MQRTTHLLTRAAIAAACACAAVGLSACSEGNSAQQCSDGRDNDGDGLADCADPDCAPYCGDDDDAGDCDAGDCDGDGWTVDEGDCDDEDADVHPDAEEACDGADNDCDGAIDEDFDGDGDGYPDAGAPGCAGAYAADQLDCDDGNPSVHPGAHEACDDGVDNDCDGTVDEEVDEDGDGVTNCGGDCDDTDPNIYPGAPETCNDLDDDCDGDVDEGLPTSLYYPDADGDGYGDPDGSPASDCGPPEGYAETADDCDDSDASVNPGADEVPCDGVDNDCDEATIDEPDADGDGYTACEDCDDGDPAISPDAVEAICDGADNDCDPATGDAPDVDGDGYSICEGAGGGDCDDGDPAVNPGEAETICDGIDNDCDPATGDDPDADGDGHGQCTDCDDGAPLVNPGMAEVCNGVDDDCDPATDESADQDGDGYSLCDGDCDDGDPTAYAGAEEICGDGVDNDCNGSVDGMCGTLDLSAAHAKLVGEQGGDELGRAASAGDVNGDGEVDFFVGAPGQGAGAAYLVHGPVVGTFDLAGASAKLTGEAWGDRAGTSAVVAGDIDGDGHLDLAIGAPDYTTNVGSEGATYVVLGPVSGTQSLAAADARLVGQFQYDYAGYALAAAGDLDGDGHDDLLIGAYGANPNGVDTGQAYLVHGPVSGANSLSIAGDRLAGEHYYDFLGYSVAAPGDVNGDGQIDLLVGAYNQYTGGNEAGAAYLVLGPTSGIQTVSNADAKLSGEAGSDSAGHSVSGAGDVNGDGYVDLLVGAPHNDAGGTNAGAAYLVLGPATGQQGLAAADARLQGPDPGGLAGWSVAGIGDVNGDGFDDVAVGAPMDDEGGADAGATYVVRGPMSGTLDLASADAKLVGEDPDDRAGIWVAPALDANGDGLDDLLVGAVYEDEGGSNAGAVYVVLGG